MNKQKANIIYTEMKNRLIKLSSGDNREPLVGVRVTILYKNLPKDDFIDVLAKLFILEYSEELRLLRKTLHKAKVEGEISLNTFVDNISAQYGKRVHTKYEEAYNQK